MEQVHSADIWAKRTISLDSTAVPWYIVV